MQERLTTVLLAIQDGDVRGMQSLLLDDAYGTDVLDGECVGVCPMLVAGR